MRRDSRWGWKRLWALGVALGAAVALGAQEEGPALRLTLDEALAKALEKNFDVRVERLVLDQAEAALKGAYGLYDPGLSLDLSTSVTRQPTSSILQAGAQANLYLNRQERYGLGLSQFTPWGQTFSLSWDNTRQKTNSRYALLNPSYGTSAALTTTLPLLKGFGRTAASRTVLVARSDRRSADAQFAQRIRDTLVQVEQDYWNLVYAVKDLEVRRRALELAKTFQEETRRKVEVGVLAPIEQIAADAQVAAREQEIIASRQAVGDRMDILKLSLGISRGDPEWGQEILPTDEPALPALNEYEEGALVEKALSLRPELKAGAERVEKARLNAAWARNQVLPQLDLTAGLTYNGISGRSLNPFTGEVISGGFSDAWKQITGLDYKSYFAGVSFKVPIGNRAARYQFRQLRLAQSAEEIAQEKLRLQVVADVRSSLRALEAARKRVEAARLTLRLQQEKLDAERKKYDNGLSTAFSVLSYQNDLSAAESALLKAEIDARLAAASLDRAVGVYLESRHVQVKP
ncbi:MAG: TolC family protein [Acidobacteriota bacterium]